MTMQSRYQLDELCPFRHSPLFSTPLYFDSLTAHSFPDLSAAIAADDIVSFALNFVSHLAKSGCIISCLPVLHAVRRSSRLLSARGHAKKNSRPILFVN